MPWSDVAVALPVTMVALVALGETIWTVIDGRWWDRQAEAAYSELEQVVGEYEANP